MKQRKVITIDDREYTVSELSVKQIIEVIESNNLTALFSGLSDVTKENPASVTQLYLMGIQKEVQAVMGKCCDFTFADLIELAPSEIKEIYLAFKEVNADFFFTLEATGIKAMLQGIKEQALSSFSKELAV